MIIYEELLREFQKQKVKYVLVGGIALNLQGALRTTNDLDMLVEMSDKNLFKIVSILKKYGYYVKQPVDPIGIADRKTREDWINNKNMKAFNFYKNKSLKEVDLVIESPVSFEKALENSDKIRVAGITLPVICIDDLIKMKKVSGRQIDELDINELRRIKRLRKKKNV